MTWLRDIVDDMNQKNRELAERELKRALAIGTAEENKPKWQVKIRLRSWSHSIRPKPLGEWNKKSEWIKLFHTSDKTELLVQFTVAKMVPIQAVWQGGMQVSWLFVISLNIATVGFFWWYLPTFVSKYYEQIFDIENDAFVSLERSPALEVSWGHQALKDAQARIGHL